jgi:hypothetical protein
VRPRKDQRSVDLISDALPFGRLRVHGGPALHSLVNRNGSVGNRYRERS